MTEATADTLSDVMDFGHVIRVTETGEVEDVDGEYAPELYVDVDADGQEYPGTDTRLHESAERQGWELLTGCTGQHCYNGPVMHSSEYIGGRMAEDILSEPGVYVAVVVEIDDPDVEDAAGWAVARKL